MANPPPSQSSVPPPSEWDAASYHRVSEPQVAWGRKVLERLPLRGDETMLDVGCGTGRLTAELAALLPRGRVVALDVSENMVRTARAGYAADPTLAAVERVDFVRADALALPFPAAFDGIFSTATFHWVRDHDKLFAELFRVLRAEGWLCAQCGGGANLARVRAGVAPLLARPDYAPYFAGFEEPWLYSDAPAAAERLRRAGFTDVRTSLDPAPVTFESTAAYRRFVGTVIFKPHVARITDPAARERFLDEATAIAAAAHPAFGLDYWRLNLWARKPA